VYVAFQEAGAEGRASVPVSSRRRGAADERRSRRIAGANQGFSGPLPLARSRLKPVIPGGEPAAGQTTPWTSRTCWPAAQDRTCGPAPIKASDVWALTCRRGPSPGRTWGSGPASWSGSTREPALRGGVGDSGRRDAPSPCGGPRGCQGSARRHP
jgi:hypothetical protein